MKRLLFLLSLIILLPVGVYADTCDSNTSEAFVKEDAVVYSYDETTDEYIPTENDIKEGTVIIVQESDDYIRYYKMCDNEGYIDEHTGEAGFITRLEAFIDMLYRKKRMLLLTDTETSDTYKPNIKYIELA